MSLAIQNSCHFFLFSFFFRRITQKRKKVFNSIFSSSGPANTNVSDLVGCVSEENFDEFSRQLFDSTEFSWHLGFRPFYSFLIVRENRKLQNTNCISIKFSNRALNLLFVDWWKNNLFTEKSLKDFWKFWESQVFAWSAFDQDCSEDWSLSAWRRLSCHFAEHLCMIFSDVLCSTCSFLR